MQVGVHRRVAQWQSLRVIGSNPISPTMVQILRKEGWVLNTNDKIVNSILKRVEENNGLCPCQNNSEDKHCPCSNYRLLNYCCCGLYKKM